MSRRSTPIPARAHRGTCRASRRGTSCGWPRIRGGRVALRIVDQRRQPHAERDALLVGQPRHVAQLARARCAEFGFAQLVDHVGRRADPDHPFRRVEFEILAAQREQRIAVDRLALERARERHGQRHRERRAPGRRKPGLRDPPVGRFAEEVEIVVQHLRDGALEAARRHLAVDLMPARDRGRDRARLRVSVTGTASASPVKP